MIDPASQNGRLLLLLADGIPRTAREIADALDLPLSRITSNAHRLHGAALMRVHGHRRHAGAGPHPKVWAITDEGRARIAEALAEKARPTE